MPPANQSGSQNQTLLELIYAMKTLAQQVEFCHQDLSRRLDEEVRSRRSELARIIDLCNKNVQAVSVLPITLSDRVEKLLEKVEAETEDRIKDLKDRIDDQFEDIGRYLQEYTKTTDRAISQNEMTAAVEAAKEKDRSDITGRIELTEKGDVRVSLNSTMLKKIWYGVVVLATGGGAYGFVELVKKLASWINS